MKLNKQRIVCSHRGMVRVGVNDGATDRWYEVTMERLNPEAADVVEGQHLFTTWMFDDHNS